MERKNVDTILVKQLGYPEPFAVIVSIYDTKVGIGLAGWGDVEVWLSQVECKYIISVLQGAVNRQSIDKDNFSFGELFSQQLNDEGLLVPAIILIAPHKDEIGLFISINDCDGGCIWMDRDSYEKVLKALRNSLKILTDL